MHSLRINVLYCSDTSELLNIQAEGVRKILQLLSYGFVLFYLVN